jgi:hypothetical protein
VTTALELLRQGRRSEIWKKYCGYLDLSLEETMQIQERLLLEQLHLLGTSELGRKLLGGRVPSTVDEFRRNVPLTTYRDYSEYLLAKREDVLPVKPYWWLHTSGRSGEYDLKWVPYTPQMARRFGENIMAALIIASSSRRGEFVFEEGDTMLFALAPFPYTSGAVARAFQAEFDFAFLPPTEAAEKMDFAERVQEGFRLALKDGIDAFYGAASVLLRIGEQFAQGAGGLKLSAYFLHPRVLFRLLRALVRSRLAGRNYLLPRDLWDVKVLATGGTDVRLFRKQIEEYWGRSTVEGFACTEGGAIAFQLRGATKGMTFFPDSNFFEFIPEADSARSRADSSYIPPTLTLAEVQAGQRYELVLTNFLGGVFTRYRLGDIIEITAERDDEMGVATPQMVFYSRADDIIDLANFARLTEAELWRAIEATHVPYADWTARKEYEDGRLILHVYLEPKDGEVDAAHVRDLLHKALLDLDQDYGHLHTMLNMDPLQVTLLQPGTFRHYYLERQAEGADLGHLKPAHTNAPDGVIQKLIRASQAVAQSSASPRERRS